MAEKFMAGRVPKRWFFGEGANRLIQYLVMPPNVEQRPLVNGERQLGHFILPPFQRPLVWTEYQKTRLIESIYLGLPIGSLIWNCTSWGHETDGWLLDGQQRMSAILEYATGNLRVNGWLYTDLPESEKSHFLRMSVSIIETNVRDSARCLDLYERLAYGGTPHQP